jgi:two-component system, OmpR family, sensor histidine kinase TctE
MPELRSPLARWHRLHEHLSLRAYLLIGILGPVAVLVLINSASVYREALEAADTAYDRTLLASAKALGEHLDIASDAQGEGTVVTATVPYSALEAFEADNRSRMYFRISDTQGRMISGFEDLPVWRGRLPARSAYAALVDFYDAEFRGQAVRVAVLLQPVAGRDGVGMATIQVAETLELRHTLARELLLGTLWRQAALIAVIAGVVVWVVQRATRPVRQLSAQLQQRGDGDLTPLVANEAPRELQPLIDANNAMMARLSQLLEHQKRFVRDASHQLRTPLAVLKTQVQSARRGDLDAGQALAEIEHTVDRATELANQMLALAKVEQLRQQGQAPVLEWARLVRDVALDLSALIADHGLEFSIETSPAPVRAHAWALRELVRNLLHNAIKSSPDGSELAVQLRCDTHHATLTIADSGPGIPASHRDHLFRPFAAGRSADNLRSGAGLGLAICQDIVQSLGGALVLDNRIAPDGYTTTGLDASVRLPLADPAPPDPTPATIR